MTLNHDGTQILQSSIQTDNCDQRKNLARECMARTSLSVFSSISASSFPPRTQSRVSAVCGFACPHLKAAISAATPLLHQTVSQPAPQNGLHQVKLFMKNYGTFAARNAHLPQSSAHSKAFCERLSLDPTPNMMTVVKYPLGFSAVRLLEAGALRHPKFPSDKKTNRN